MFSYQSISEFLLKKFISNDFMLLETKKSRWIVSSNLINNCGNKYQQVPGCSKSFPPILNESILLVNEIWGIVTTDISKVLW